MNLEYALCVLLQHKKAPSPALRLVLLVGDLNNMHACVIGDHYGVHDAKFKDKHTHNAYSGTIVTTIQVKMRTCTGSFSVSRKFQNTQ
jgi:hypothetical protein